MNNFVFYSPTEFVFGKNTEVQVGALARKYGAQKVMIVYGGGSVVRSGLLDRVKQSLQEAGVAYCEMGGVQPNPIDGKVYEGIQLCRREQVDMMLPVGGGSVIDTAKAIAAGALYDGDFWDFLYRSCQGGESVESSRGADYPGCRKRRFGQYGNYQDRDTPKTGTLCPRAFASRIFHHES